MFVTSRSKFSVIPAGNGGTGGTGGTSVAGVGALWSLAFWRNCGSEAWRDLSMLKRRVMELCSWTGGEMGRWTSPSGSEGRGWRAGRMPSLDLMPRSEEGRFSAEWVREAGSPRLRREAGSRVLRRLRSFSLLPGRRPRSGMATAAENGDWQGQVGGIGTVARRVRRRSRVVGAGGGSKRSRKVWDGGWETRGPRANWDLSIRPVGPVRLSAESVMQRGQRFRGGQNQDRSRDGTLFLETEAANERRR